MTLPTYNVGTVSVANGGTTVTGVGTIWSGVNAAEGDYFIVPGVPGHAVITEVTDPTHLQITPWAGTTVAASAYKIEQNFVGRVVGVAAAEYVASLLSALPGLVTLAGDQTLTGKLTFSNTTEATGAGTTAAALFKGGVEIAKKLFVTGAVSLASTLNVAGAVALASTLNVTGVSIHSGATTLSAALTYGGVTLANSVTGTGSMVLSANPTFTGTLNAATIAASGGATLAGALIVNNLAGITNGVNGIQVGALAKATAGSTAGFYTVSNDASSQLIGQALVISDPTASNRRLQLSILENTVAWRTVSIAENGGAVAIAASASGSYVAPTGLFQVYANANTGILLTSADGSTLKGVMYNTGGTALGIGTLTNHSLQFYTNNAQRAFFDTNGNFLMAATGGIYGGHYGSGLGLDFNVGSNSAQRAATFINTHATAGDGNILMGVGSSGADSSSAYLEFYDGPVANFQGQIRRNGAGAVAYLTSSDIRGKPNRERVSEDYARSIIDALEIYDFDKDGNAIRGIGVIAQQACAVHKSLASPGRTEKEWWCAEKAAPMPFVVANLQQVNRRLDEIERRLNS